jgi:hypothetical protein
MGILRILSHWCSYRNRLKNNRLIVELIDTYNFRSQKFLYRAPMDLKESERITQKGLMSYMQTIFDSNEDEIYLTLQLIQLNCVC